MLNPQFYDIIRRPVITEKTSMVGAYGKYVFEVLPVATKALIKKAIEAIFAVGVVKVNIINTKGKRKRFKGRFGTRSDVKKVIVTLSKGDSIDIAGWVK